MAIEVYVIYMHYFKNTTVVAYADLRAKAFVKLTTQQLYELLIIGNVCKYMIPLLYRNICKPRPFHLMACCFHVCVQLVQLNLNLTVACVC